MAFKKEKNNPYEWESSYAYLPKEYKVNGQKHTVWLRKFEFRAVDHQHYYTWQYRVNGIVSDEEYNSSID